MMDRRSLAAFWLILIPFCGVSADEKVDSVKGEEIFINVAQNPNHTLKISLNGKEISSESQLLSFDVLKDGDNTLEVCSSLNPTEEVPESIDLSFQDRSEVTVRAFTGKETFVLRQINRYGVASKNVECEKKSFALSNEIKIAFQSPSHQNKQKTLLAESNEPTQGLDGQAEMSFPATPPVQPVQNSEKETSSREVASAFESEPGDSSKENTPSLAEVTQEADLDIKTEAEAPPSETTTSVAQSEFSPDLALEANESALASEDLNGNIPIEPSKVESPESIPIANGSSDGLSPLEDFSSSLPVQTSMQALVFEQLKPYLKPEWIALYFFLIFLAQMIVASTLSIEPSVMRFIPILGSMRIQSHLELSPLLGLLWYVPILNSFAWFATGRKVHILVSGSGGRAFFMGLLYSYLGPILFVLDRKSIQSAADSLISINLDGSGGDITRTQMASDLEFEATKVAGSADKTQVYVIGDEDFTKTQMESEEFTFTGTLANDLDIDKTRVGDAN